MLEIIICAVSGVVVGGIIGFLLCYFIPIFAKKRAEIKAEKIIKSAEIKAEHLQKNATLDAKQQVYETRSK